jgi:hypothetical protein
MKKEGKIIALFLGGLFMISLLAMIVAAQEPAQTAEKVGSTLGSVVAGFFKGILSPLFGDQQIMTRFFLALLLGLIIYNILPSILGKGKTGISVAIAVVITLLAILSTPKDLLDVIVTQYSAMGAAILTVIPFVIVLVTSVRIQNALAARVIWLAYVVYYISLYIYKIAIAPEGSWAGVNLLYLGAIILGIAIFFSIGAIRNLLFKGEMSALKETGEEIVARGGLLHKLQKKELERSYGSSE